MKVKELMSKDLKTIDIDSNVREAKNLMEKYGISRLLVKDKGKIVGILTERDLAIRMASWRERKLSDAHIHVSAVTTKKLITIDEDEEISEAARIMLENGISSLVVESKGEIVGIVTKTDLIKSLKDSGIKVTEYMTRRVKTLPVGSTLLQARRLMLQNGIKRIPIILDGKLIGMVTEKDIAKALGLFRKISESKQWDEKMKKILVEEIMSKDVISVSEDTTLGEAVDIMLEKNISGLPVIKEGKIFGIITKTDLTRAVRILRP